MRPRGHLPKPAIFSRRLLSLAVRSVAIASMSFAAAFGFLSGATSPGAHYDPHTFAIGVVGAVRCRLRRHWHPHLAHPPDEDRAARHGNASRRGGGSQLGNQRSAGAHQELFRDPGRRDRAPRQRRRHHLCQRCLLCACRPHARRHFGDRVCASGRGTGRNHVARRRHAHLRPEDRRARRRALDRLARGRGAGRLRQRDAKRRPRRDRPRTGRAGARRGARSGGNGEPRQIALPGHGVA